MDGLDLKDYLTIFKRRKAYFFTVACAVFLLSVVFALRLSNYRSTATIAIMASDVSSDATVATNNGIARNESSDTLPEVRISRLQQKVLSVESLNEIITQFHLYGDAPKGALAQDMAARMQKKIGVDFIASALTNPISTNASAQQPIAFTVSFDYSNPAIAQKVTSELVTRFISEDIKERHRSAHETSQFLDTQIKVLEKSMEEQEKKIAEFRAANGDTHPESLVFNQQATQSISLNIQNVDSQISTNETTLSTLRSQMASVDPYSRVVADGQVLTTPTIQLKALRAQYTTLSAQYGPQHPDVVKLSHQIQALQRSSGGSHADTSELRSMISDTQTNLDAATKTYGPDHPDVVTLKHKLASLETQLKNANKGSAQDSVKNDADNPAYLQIVTALTSAEEQRKALMKQKDNLLAQQEKYQMAIAANPAAEQKIATLSRDYDNAQLRYRTLKEKKMTADMGEAIEDNKSGERLQVINPPDLPLHTQPGRSIYLIAGIVLAGISGLFSVIIAQILSQSVVGVHHLESLVGVAPLVAIPYIATEKEIKAQSRVRDRMIGLGVIGGGIVLCFVIFHFLF